MARGLPIPKSVLAPIVKKWAAAPRLLDACVAARTYIEEYGTKNDAYFKLHRQLNEAIGEAEPANG